MSKIPQWNWLDIQISGYEIDAIQHEISLVRHKHSVKIMNKEILFAALLSIFWTSAVASEWNNFASVGNQDSEYFFDAESVNKTKDTVTLWVKSVQKSKVDKDGFWSMANNWQINCSKRTIKGLTWSTYDSAGQFIRSNSTGGLESSVVPDSIGEGVLKVACMADFPRNTPSTKTSYFKVGDNDIFAATKRFIELYESQVDKAPK